MPGFEIGGKHIETDTEGYLVDLDDWSEEAAAYIARAEGLEMTDARWEAINLIKDYYKKVGIAPMIKLLKKEMKKKFGPEKGSMEYLDELFPNGAAKQGAKIAGLPKPTGCI